MLRRTPAKTRPLNLANTDCKIISSMLSIVLSVVCSSCICSLQSGGMRGKQMIDLIFTLEAIIKLIALRCTYFKDGWNNFDFVVVIGSLVAVFLTFFPNLGIDLSM